MNGLRPLIGQLNRLLRLDLPLLAGIVLVASAGLFVLWSASEQNPAVLVRQLIRLGVGFGVMLVLTMTPPRLLRIWTPWLFAATLVLLLAVWFFGVGRGAQRWLDLGLLRFQPSELMKLALPMMIAWYLHDKVLPVNLRQVAVVLVLIAVPTLLIYRQPDLGTALLVAVSGGFTLYLAGLSWRLIGGVLVASAASAPALWMVMHEYQRNRIRTFLNPESDPLGEGWNIIQSKIAVGSGGITGKGWLQGSQSHLEFLPEHSTDFILAVLAEEFGLIGVVILLLLYLFLVGRGLQIAVLARDTYTRLLAGALAMTFFVYVLVNCGMVSGLLPVVGVPLPLISYGGTSIVTLMAGFGIMMSAYAHRKFLN